MIIMSASCKYSSDNHCLVSIARWSFIDRARHLEVRGSIPFEFSGKLGILTFTE